MTDERPTMTALQLAHVAKENDGDDWYEQQPVYVRTGDGGLHRVLDLNWDGGVGGFVLSVVARDPGGEAVMSDPKFGLRCIDPDHAGRGYGNVYPLVAGQDRLHGLVGGVPCYELVASYDGGQTWMSAPSESAGVERLRERHVPTVAAASTPGVWNVYCAACSDAAQDYATTCDRWTVPAQLVDAVELATRTGERDDALLVLADLTDLHPCEFDHHGHCQAHGWLQRGECADARAQRLLAGSTSDGGSGS